MSSSIHERSTCSCGDPAPHIIATRVTFDDVPCRLWSDGLFELRGPGELTRYVRTAAQDAWRTLELVATYDAAQAFALAHWSSRSFLRRFAAFGVVVPRDA